MLRMKGGNGSGGAFQRHAGDPLAHVHKSTNDSASWETLQPTQLIGSGALAEHPQSYQPSTAPLARRTLWRPCRPSAPTPNLKQ